MSPNNGILVNSVLRLKRLNIPFASCSFINLGLFLRHTCDIQNNLMIALLYHFFKNSFLIYIFCFFVVVVVVVLFVCFFVFCASSNVVTGFIMACIWYMKYFRLMLSQSNFLSVFLFENLDFLTTQLAHFDACLITLFVIITFFDQYYWYVYNLSNKFSWFYNDQNGILTTCFNFIKWSGMNSDVNSFF